MMLYSMYLAEREIEKFPCPRTEHKGIMTLWEDRVGKGGWGSVAGSKGRGACWAGGGGSLRHRFNVDIEGIMKL